jgi:hypothetical protein
MASLQNRKSELILALDQARRRASTHASGVRQHAHPGKKLRASFSQHKLAWLGGAALLGLVLARPSRRNKKTSSAAAPDSVARSAKAGLLIGALKLAFDLSKPLLTSWATNQLTELAKKNAARGFRYSHGKAQQGHSFEQSAPF